VFNNANSWLEKHLLAEIKSSDRSHTFISSVGTLYDEHISLYETNDEIVIDELEPKEPKLSHV
jgi:hypothetical protein